MMEHAAKHAENDELRLPMLPLAILLAAVILSGAIFYSANQITSNMNEMKAAIIAGSVNRPAATATPAPTPATGGTGGTGLVPGDETRPFRGTANAPVTIVEYSDYQCPYCSRAEPTIAQFMADYPGKIKLIFKNFPLPFHENAQKASEAAECAADQGKFWEMHDVLYENQGTLDVASLKQYAAGLGLNTATFNSCLDSGAKAAVVASDLRAGQDAGVEGTPSFLINGKLVVGAQPLATFKTEIDAALAAEGG